MSKSFFLDGNGDFHNWANAKNQNVTYKGTYDSSASYKKSDIVLDQGASYICLQDSVGNLTSNASFWGLMAQKGGSTTLDDLGSTSTTTTYSASKIESSLNAKANLVHTHTLDNITDIDTTNKTNGYTLQYDSTVSKFVSKALPTGSGTGATSMSGLSDVDVTTTPPINDNVLTYEAGKWIPKAPSSGETYIIELSRWSISNNGTNAVTTTTGINNALSWANTNNYGVVILPIGTYSIDKDSSVKLQSNTHYKFYGCLFVKQANNYANYETITIDGIKNTTLEGGSLKGDRESHDYSVNPTSEGGYGVYVKNACYNILVKNVESYEFTGDGFNVGGQNFDSPGGMQYPQHFAKGDIDSTGNVDATKTNYTTIAKFFDVTTTLMTTTGYFYYAAGGDGGYGTGCNLNKTPIKVHCYKADLTYLGYLVTRSYEFVQLSSLPTGTTQVRFSYLQNYDLLNGNLHYVLCAKHPLFVTLKGCKSYRNRRQGCSVGGARHLLFEDCEFFDISQTMPNSTGITPGFGIDVEDGYMTNQQITIRNCYFHNNRIGDVSLVSSRGVRLLGNKFNSYVRLTGSGDDYLSEGNEYYGNIAGMSITSGVEADGTFCTFRSDSLFNKTVLVTGGNTLFDNCVFSKSYINTSGETVKFERCKFTFDDPDATSQAILFGNKYLEVRECLFDIRRTSSISGRGGFSSGGTVSAIFTDTKFLMGDYSGGTIVNAQDLIIQNCQFINNSTSVANYSRAIASNSMLVERCTFQDVSFRIDSGSLYGSSDFTTGDAGYSTHLFRNNKILWTSSTVNPATFEARGQGVALLYLARVDVIDNSITVTGQGTSLGQLYNLRIFAENYVNLSNNYVSTTNASGISTTGGITIDYAYRSGTSLLRPKTIFISQNNKLDVNSTIAFTSNFNTQLEKNIIGTAPKYQVFASATPTQGYFDLGEFVYNSNPTAGGYVGWINVTAGYADTATWAASTLYPARSRVLSAGKIYEAQNAGKSTATQPTFPASGTVDDKVGATTWTQSTLYSAGNLVLPSVANGYYYECTTGGTSGATEPTWSKTANTAMSSTADNGVVWTPRQIITWKQVGVPTVFKPFGVIRQSTFGTATMNLGTSTVTVSHGLGAIPTNITTTPQGNIGNWWISNIDATQFIINVASNIASNTQISWRAEL